MSVSYNKYWVLAEPDTVPIPTDPHDLIELNKYHHVLVTWTGVSKKHFEQHITHRIRRVVSIVQKPKGLYVTIIIGSRRHKQYRAFYFDTLTYVALTTEYGH